MATAGDIVSDTTDPTELIAAIATPPGMGGVGMLRLSGPGAQQVAAKIVGVDLTPRQVRHCDFVNPFDGELIDQGLALWFVHGQSFTGEEVIELHTHGSPVVLQQLLQVVCELGARVARPGEFSERAFLNGKLDLAQAEAIADLIASGSAAAARAAARSLKGEFSKQVFALAEQLEMLRVFVEAVIDFPEEEVEHLQQAQVEQSITDLQQSLQALIDQAQQGRLINDGVTVALVGPPNAGKSSLLNALSGEDAAIVTDIPGTTRDVLKVDLVLDGVPVRLADTAGLRSSEDVVEQLGIQRAHEQLAQADLVVLVLDVSQAPDTLDWAGWILQQVSQLGLSDQIVATEQQVMLVLNKTDVLPQLPELAETDAPYPVIPAAIKFEQGVAEIRQALLNCLGKQADEAPFTARARHLVALGLAQADLQQALENLRQGEPAELIAEELRSAHLHMGEIVGITTPDDLLGRIFSEFCIGK